MDHFPLDSYPHLKNIDGYEIELSKDAPEKMLQRSFISLILELINPMNLPQTVHKEDVVLLDHVSQCFDVEDLLEIGNVDDYFISVEPSSSHERTLPISEYIRLDTLLLNS